ncbi:carboxymuconolactone decarboxylase family protein [Silvimonas amylolytica]|uniref:Carboxymuconolactone decarboxylase n=1 Tax=Silvimonas amylolytica TaxID=449663 RepID=A0ABQ2PI24_9NEIS|nr:carboxymuconolactone decarboxylase family protein [Silvimonas amylolytica]GGP25013.1 carboxymuconolactone decarboxylase [Silvimonas amylolytica]
MNDHTRPDRLPPLAMDELNEAQRKAAQALIDGPRKGVKGPFVPLLRSPELMDRIQRVGEYLRYDSILPRRINEWVTAIVAREWSEPFEWSVHYPLARDAGVAQATLDELAQGARPQQMAVDEALAYDFTMELMRNKGISDLTWQRALTQWQEQGVVELVGLIGYFTGMVMMLNAAHTPAINPVPLPALPR